MDELNMSLTVFHTGSSFASARSPTSSWDAAAFIVSPKLDAKNHAVEAREPDEEFAPPPCASASSVLSASPAVLARPLFRPCSERTSAVTNKKPPLSYTFTDKLYFRA